MKKAISQLLSGNMLSKVLGLVRERDANQLAERIDYLLNNEQTSFEMGDNARNFIREKFNLSEQTLKLEKIYQELIHG